MKRLMLLPLALGLTAGCRGGDSGGGAGGPINAADIARHVQVLASDSFGGRAPSSPGEEKSVNYIRDQLTSIGLEPGNAGSFFQNVPLVEITGDMDRFLANHPQARDVIGAQRIEQAYHKLYLDLARSHLWAGENREAWQAAWQARRHGPSSASWPLMAKACVPSWLRDQLGSRRKHAA